MIPLVQCNIISRGITFLANPVYVTVLDIVLQNVLTSNTPDGPARVAQWSKHSGAMCSRA